MQIHTWLQASISELFESMHQLALRKVQSMNLNIITTNQTSSAH